MPRVRRFDHHHASNFLRIQGCVNLHHRAAEGMSHQHVRTFNARLLQHGMHVFRFFLVGLALRLAKAPARAKAVVDADARKFRHLRLHQGPMRHVAAGARRDHHHRLCRRVARAVQVQAVLAYVHQLARRRIFLRDLCQGDLLGGTSRQEQQDEQRNQPAQHQQAPSQAAPGFSNMYLFLFAFS